MTRFSSLSLPLGRGIAVAALATLAGLAHAGKKPPVATGSWDAASATTSYSFQPLATDDTVNPMRGYHLWQNQALVPVPNGMQDSFRRYYWSELETSPGVYNFSLILSDIQKAKEAGRKFAFRLRNMAGYDDDNRLFTPSYMVNNPLCLSGCGFWVDHNLANPEKTFIPDWNDPYVIARSRELLKALKAELDKYGVTNSIAWIDVGMVGQYGEWAVLSSVYANAPAAITPVTLANKREYAKMHFEVFPSQQHVMFVPYSNEDALTYGLLEQTITAKPVGLRVDCLSRDGYFRQWSDRPTHWLPFANQWKKAPFVAEFCPFETLDPLDNPATARVQAATYHISTIGNGNFQLQLPDAERWSKLTPQEQEDLRMLGREAGYRYGVERTAVSVANGVLNFSATLRNDGNAPTYEPWSVRVELVNGVGAVSWTGLLGSFNLNALSGAGTSQMAQASFTLPALAAGSYKLRVIARDTRASTSASPARPPLKWVNQGLAGDGLTVMTLVRR
ncbi:MAG: DUF4832 domain-containing protein [Pseudomonadota bacterium]